MKPIIYIAGPYYDPDPLIIRQNILAARKLAAVVHATGVAYALVPHNISEGIEHTLTEEQWADFTMELLRLSGGTIIRTFHGFLGRTSLNTQKELVEARNIGKPIFDMTLQTLDYLFPWLQHLHKA